jgi:hypothetical protein
VSYTEKRYELLPDECHFFCSKHLDIEVLLSGIGDADDDTTTILL